MPRLTNCSTTVTSLYFRFTNIDLCWHVFTYKVEFWRLLLNEYKWMSDITSCIYYHQWRSLEFSRHGAQPCNNLEAVNRFLDSISLATITYRQVLRINRWEITSWYIIIFRTGLRRSRGPWPRAPTSRGPTKINVVLISPVRWSFMWSTASMNN